MSSSVQNSAARQGESRDTGARMIYEGIITDNRSGLTPGHRPTVRYRETAWLGVGLRAG